MKNKIIKAIVKYYSYFPILSLTDDNNFGTNELNKDASYRLSLINLFLGNIAIYVITYNISNKKFSFFKRLKMEDCAGLKLCCDLENITEKSQQYMKEHLESLNDNDLSIEKDFIKYLDDRQLRRIEISERKIGAYTAIILAVIPLIIAFFDINSFLQYCLLEKICLLIIAYCVVNITIFVFNSMKVQGVSLSCFSDLRNSTNKKKMSVKQYYYDWQMHSGKANVSVSYVKNIEDWIRICVVCLVLFAIISNVGALKSGYIVNAPLNETSNLVCTINIDELEDPFSDSSVTMADLNLRIREKKIEEIIFIIPHEIYIDDILAEFAQYRDNLTVKYFVDDSLVEKNEFKILEG